MMSRFPVAFRPPAFRFSVIRFPPRDWALLTVGLPANGRTSTGLPRSAHTSSDWVGCLLYPGDDGALSRPERLPGRRLPHLSDMSLNPAPASHPAGLRLTRHQRRFTQFTRPVFPSPVASRMEREPSGFPLSFEPRRPEPDNARQGGDRPTEHGPETTLYDISRTSNPACLLVVCDLASHGVNRQRR
jgi:hypothetical protein